MTTKKTPSTAARDALGDFAPKLVELRSLKHASRLPCVIAVVLASSACAHRPSSRSPRTGGDAFAHTTAEGRGTTAGGEDWFTG